MAAWNQLHSDPRISYYRFLREHGLSAKQAHANVKRIDAMVVGLRGDRRRSRVAYHFSLTSLWKWLRAKFVRHAAGQDIRIFRPSRRPANWGRRWSDIGSSAS